MLVLARGSEARLVVLGDDTGLCVVPTLSSDIRLAHCTHRGHARESSKTENCVLKAKAPFLLSVVLSMRYPSM